MIDSMKISNMDIIKEESQREDNTRASQSHSLTKKN